MLGKLPRNVTWVILLAHRPVPVQLSMLVLDNGSIGESQGPFLSSFDARTVAPQRQTGVHDALSCTNPSVLWH